MAKTLLSIEDLRWRALAEIRKQPGCADVQGIAIDRVSDQQAENNWSLCVVSAGAADANTAARAALHVQSVLRRDYDPGVLTSQRFGQRSRIMTATSIARIFVPSLALVAACGAALIVGITHVRREPPVETRAATAAPAVAPPTSGARDEGSAALAMAEAEANALAAAPAVSPRSPDTDESVPVFDIARIERTGDAVIAGRAAPGIFPVSCQQETHAAKQLPAYSITWSARIGMILVS